MTGAKLPIIVMDLEWTAWDGSRARCWSGPGEEMELVQIGAVKLADTPSLNEIDAFEILIRPRINPTLDQYFLDLTGITQKQVDREGMDLRVGLAMLCDFVGDVRDLYGFGDETLHIVVNCRLYGMVNPLAYCRGVDVRPEVIDLIGVDRVPNSSELPGLMGFDPPGAIHQGLADSRCVAEALRRLRADGKF
ncbi:MAG: 3'-5' exonuclease [Rhodospirillaceae bacterium]